MKVDRRKVISLFIVLVMVGSVIAVAYSVCNVPDSKRTVFVGETIGTNSYMNPVFDITYDDLSDAGYVCGDTFDITVKDVTIHSAILSRSFMGTFILDTYLNVEKDGHLAGGTMWMNILPADIGNKVTITYTGHNADYSKLDKFLTPYTDDRSDYDDDASFANFYEVTGGNIKSGTLYRSFDPFNLKTSRSAYVNEQASIHGVNYDIALSYSDSKMTAAILSEGEGYCYDIIRNGDYSNGDITYHYFIMKDLLRELLTDMSENEGPYLIHCNVGRDRTGFFSTLLQALCGADADTMKSTAAQAYVNLYHVEKDSEEYRVIVSSTYCRNIYYIEHYEDIENDLPSKLPIDWHSRDVSKIDTQKAAYEFCTGYLGLSEDVIDDLMDKLCG